MKIPIESGIPIPKPNIGHKKGKSKYPFNKLEVGQSFPIPITSTNKKSVYVYARSNGVKLGKKFAVRKIESEKVFRIWRTA